jgi:hypothetical protein
MSAARPLPGANAHSSTLHWYTSSPTAATAQGAQGAHGAQGVHRCPVEHLRAHCPTHPPPHTHAAYGSTAQLEVRQGPICSPKGGYTLLLLQRRTCVHIQVQALAPQHPQQLAAEHHEGLASAAAQAAPEDLALHHRRLLCRQVDICRAAPHVAVELSRSGFRAFQVWGVNITAGPHVGEAGRC